MVANKYKKPRLLYCVVLDKNGVVTCVETYLRRMTMGDILGGKWRNRKKIKKGTKNVQWMFELFIVWCYSFNKYFVTHCTPIGMWNSSCTILGCREKKLNYIHLARQPDHQGQYTRTGQSVQAPTCLPHHNAINPSLVLLLSPFVSAVSCTTRTRPSNCLVRLIELHFTSSRSIFGTDRTVLDASTAVFRFARANIELFIRTVSL